MIATARVTRSMLILMAVVFALAPYSACPPAGRADASIVVRTTPHRPSHLPAASSCQAGQPLPLPYLNRFYRTDGDCVDYTIQNRYIGSPLDVTSTTTSMEASVIISAGANMTIEPGVTISATTNTGIVVLGTLNVNGTSQAPATLTGFRAATGIWSGIDFRPGSSGTLTYMHLSYAGSFQRDSTGVPYFSAILVEGSNPSITNSAIDDSSSVGIEVIANGAPTLSQDSFTDNRLAALLYQGFVPSLKWINAGLSAKGNGFDGLEIAPGNIGTPNSALAAGKTLTLDNPGFPFLQIDSMLTISSGASMAVNNTPSTIKFARDGLVVLGSLTLKGTSTTPVSVTTSSPRLAPGQWSGINFRPGSKGTLDYVHLSYGGAIQHDSSGKPRYSGILVEGSSPSITHSTIDFSAANDVEVLNGGTPHVNHDTLGPVQSSLYYGVLNDDPTSSRVDATCNWWGTANGPSANGKNTGGVQVSAGVAYTPWSTKPNGPCTSSTSVPTPSLTPTASPTSVHVTRPTSTPAAVPSAAAVAIDVAPRTANPGGLVTVTGQGFGAGEDVQIGLDGAVLTTVKAGSDGSLPPSGIAVPFNAGTGSHVVFALGLQTHRRATASVDVLSVHPGLGIDQTTTHIGRKMCATGRAFLSGEPVTLAVDGVAVATTSASAGGGFTSCFTVPGVIVDGANEITAVGARSRTPVVVLFTGIVSPPSTFFFAGASTAGGDETEIAVLNPQLHPSELTLRFYLPAALPVERAVEVPGQTRITLALSRYVPGVRGFGLRLDADRVVAAQMIVRRGNRNPYTSLGSGLLSQRWYLAEGYTGLSFHETIYVLNPGPAASSVSLRLLPFNGKGARSFRYVVPSERIVGIDVNRLYPRASLAALITSDLPTSVERVLTFGDGAYGATGNPGTPRAATTWLFAEGSAAGRNQTFLTILNPGRKAARVTAVMVDQHGHALGARTVVVQGLHRGNIRLNDVTHAAAIATTLTSNVPVVVERPFYLGNPNKGHTGASLVFGRSGSGTRWTFPAGDSRTGARETLLLLNPTVNTLAVRVVFFSTTGETTTRSFSVKPGARFTIDVRKAVPELANSLHSVQLSATSGKGFVAEQSIYNKGATTVYGTAGLAQ